MLTPAAIVIAALLAARWARRNIQVELDHDRGVREREAERQVLDEVIMQVTNADHAYAESAGAIRDLMGVRKMANGGFPPGSEVDARNTQNVLHTAHRSLVGAGYRLRVRFRRDDELVVRFDEWEAAFDAYMQASERFIESSSLSLESRLGSTRTASPTGP